MAVKCSEIFARQRRRGESRGRAVLSTLFPHPFPLLLSLLRGSFLAPGVSPVLCSELAFAWSGGSPSAQCNAHELKEKKEKLEEKTVCKEKKKEIIEDEENGAEEEENPEDVDEEEAGEEDDDGDENGQEQDGHAAKRSAEEEEEDEVDPKRQKTENGSSA
ncbi:parathymosin isoform X1 [Caretta caretta]|uniref:parathymosin isoform X1 n=1 Tax=Caretta caretta TaxID=8467 RepID=UPI003D47AACC